MSEIVLMVKPEVDDYDWIGAYESELMVGFVNAI